MYISTLTSLGLELKEIAVSPWSHSSIWAFCSRIFINFAFWVPNTKLCFLGTKYVCIRINVSITVSERSLILLGVLTIIGTLHPLCVVGCTDSVVLYRNIFVMLLIMDDMILIVRSLIVFSFAIPF